MLCAGSNSNLDSQVEANGTVSRWLESACAVVAKKRGGASILILGRGVRIMHHDKVSSFAIFQSSQCFSDSAREDTSACNIFARGVVTLESILEMNSRPWRCS